MKDYRKHLFSRAFQIVEGSEYNRASYELREENRQTLRSIYEVVLEESHTWNHLKEKVYPPLVRYLKYKGLHPSSGIGLVVSVFFKDSFYLIEGSHFLQLYCEMENLAPEAFYSHVMKWLSGETREKEPLLLR